MRRTCTGVPRGVLRPLLAGALGLASACGDCGSEAPSDAGRPRDSQDGDALDAMDGAGDARDAAECRGTQTHCDGLQWSTCDAGVFVASETCPTLCDDTLGCIVCVPGTGTCEGDVSHACLVDGSGTQDVYCDPVQAMACGAESGICEGPCAPAELGDGYIGCDYFPTVTANVVDNDFSFAVAVSNSSPEQAHVTIEDGLLTEPIEFDVAGDDVQVQALPWIWYLKDRAGVLVTEGAAYHLRSTRPVTVYQFNPLEYTDGVGNYSQTNDASLLLPSSVLTGDYIVVGWPHFWDAPSLVTITATQPDTTVMFTPTADASALYAPSYTAGTPATVELDLGGVLEMGSTTGDLTGTRISADKPIQVIAGHYCTFIPPTHPACDHIEETIFPLQTLGTRVVVSAPAVPALPDGKERYIRIVATEANTELTFDPEIPGAPSTIDAIGGLLEVRRQQGDYVITANHPIVVAEFMEAMDIGGNMGDPAMTLAVPVEQYRAQYLFHAPTNYETNYVNITASIATNVTVDGETVTLTPLGSTGFGVARWLLSNEGNGNHTAEGSGSFGVSVYGYGRFTSYWYPGGLDLQDLLTIQ